MNPVGQRDQLGREHVERPQVGVDPADEQVVLPHEEAEQRDAEHSRHREPVAPQRLAREHRQELEHDPESRQRDDVDLGMPEHPEQVLEQDTSCRPGRRRRTRSGSVRSIAPMSSAAISIGAASIIRTAVASTLQTKIGSRDQVIPGARIVMIVASRLNPNRRHRHADQREEADVGVVAGGVLVAERLVAGPAGLEAAEEDRRDQDDAGGHQQPERERLDPRERHPARADHQRHEPVGERPQDPRGHHPHHHRAVQADQRQVLVGAEHVRVGLEQLGPDQHRVQAADRRRTADPDQVLHRDDLVVGAQPEVPSEALVLALVLGQRRRVAEQPAERVVERSRGRQETDHAEHVAEEDRDVVLPRLGE